MVRHLRRLFISTSVVRPVRFTPPVISSSPWATKEIQKNCYLVRNCRSQKESMMPPKTSILIHIPKRSQIRNPMGVQRLGTWDRPSATWTRSGGASRASRARRAGTPRAAPSSSSSSPLTLTVRPYLSSQPCPSSTFPKAEH